MRAIHVVTAPPENANRWRVSTPARAVLSCTCTHQSRHISHAAPSQESPPAVTCQWPHQTPRCVESGELQKMTAYDMLRLNELANGGLREEHWLGYGRTLQDRHLHPGGPSAVLCPLGESNCKSGLSMGEDISSSKESSSLRRCARRNRISCAACACSTDILSQHRTISTSWAGSCTHPPRRRGKERGKGAWQQGGKKCHRPEQDPLLGRTCRPGLPSG